MYSTPIKLIDKGIWLNQFINLGYEFLQEIMVFFQLSVRHPQDCQQRIKIVKLQKVVYKKARIQRPYP